MVNKDLVPKKAIITASSSAEADSLLKFLEECGYCWERGGNCWDNYEENTCYSLETHGDVVYCSREWFEKHGPSDPCWPDDPEFQFISAEDFMSICQGFGRNAESEMEIEPTSLDDIL